MKQKEYTSKEGAAAYGYEGIFKVSSVAFITPLRDLTSKNRQKGRQTGRQKGFGQILAEKTEQLQENRSMEGMAIGYTKTGQPCICQPMQRTYEKKLP